MQDVTVLAERAETVARDPAYRECCAVVTARAVAELRVLSEYTLPFLRLEGRLLAPKGADIEREVQDAQQALRVLGGRLVSIEPVTLPGFDPKTLVVIEKIAKTTRAYPRSAGTPGNRPL